jgi:hypothetical protein
MNIIEIEHANIDGERRKESEKYSDSELDCWWILQRL